MQNTATACLHALSPPGTKEIQCYIGMTQDATKRYITHKRDSVNKRVKKARSVTDFALWKANVWFCARKFPIGALFFMETFGIIAFDTTNPNHGLQCNITDYVHNVAKIHVGTLQRMIRVLDNLCQCQEYRLPNPEDKVAWRQICEHLLDSGAIPGANAKRSTISLIIKYTYNQSYLSPRLTMCYKDELLATIRESDRDKTALAMTSVKGFAKGLTDVSSAIAAIATNLLIRTHHHQWPKPNQKRQLVV